MKRLIIISVVIVISKVSLGQDLTLSQYFNLPALVNPASTGNFPEQYRATLAYKSQWGVITEPFVSSVFSAEISLKKSNQAKNHLSFGVLAVSDKAGNSGYKAGIYRGMGAYHLTVKKGTELSFGLEAGYNQRAFSLDGLSWDSQYNGVGYDSSLPTNESILQSSLGYIDFGMGAELRNKSSRFFKWHTGIGIHHYYQNQTHLENGQDRLPTLVQLYWQGDQTKGSFTYNYYSLLQAQNGIAALSGIIGADLNYRFNSDSKFTNFKTSSAVTAGLFYRYRDAIVALIGYEYKRVCKFSISYDINTSSLNQVTQLRSGPEFNFIYLGNFAKKRRKIK